MSTIGGDRSGNIVPLQPPGPPAGGKVDGPQLRPVPGGGGDVSAAASKETKSPPKPSATELPPPRPTAGGANVGENRFLSPNAFVAFVVMFSLAARELSELRVQENKVTIKEMKAIGEVATAIAELVRASAKTQAEMEIIEAFSHGVQGIIAVGGAIGAGAAKRTAKKGYGKSKIADKKADLKQAKNERKKFEKDNSKTLSAKGKQTELKALKAKETKAAKDLDQTIADNKPKGVGLYNKEKQEIAAKKESLATDKKAVDSNDKLKKLESKKTKLNKEPKPITEKQAARLTKINKELETTTVERGKSLNGRDMGDVEKNYKSESKSLGERNKTFKDEVNSLENEALQEAAKGAEAASQFTQMIEKLSKYPKIIEKGNIDALIEVFRGHAKIIDKSLQSASESSKGASQMIKEFMDMLKQMSQASAEANRNLYQKG